MMRHILAILAALSLCCASTMWAADEAPTTTPAATAPAETAPAAEVTPPATDPAPAADATPAPAAPAPTVDSGNTAWMLMSVCLVLLMTIPGLFLFYGGMVRSKNALSVVMQCFAICCMVTIIWTVYGYSMAFSTAGMEKGVTNLASFFGGFDRAFASGINLESFSINGVPESVFFVFQLTFAIITPALIVGAFAERMKFSTMMVFSAAWVTIVYFPICHMVWSGNGGLMWDWGVLDFAGGTVVHINAGVAGLIACIMLGKRKGYPQRPMPPHNLVYTVVGASLLWVGWFGFNAGSAVSAGQGAGMAMLVTQVATGTAGFAWMMCEWIRHGKPSALGIASGAIAGLVAITPASGFVGPVGALVIGLASGVICFISVAVVKRMLGYDDSLDAFGVHGIGGIVGAVLTGAFAAPALGGFGTVGTGAEGTNSIGGQLWIQIESVLFTIVWCGVGTAVILAILKPLMGLRVSEDDEEQGLDLTQHGEEAYNHTT